MLVRRYCRARGLAVSSSFHTRFPEYVSARLPVPESLGLGGPALVPQPVGLGDGGDAAAGAGAERARLRQRAHLAARRRCEPVPAAR